MDQITYIPSLCVIICKTCHTGVLGGSLRSHLHQFPHNIPMQSEEIRAAVQWVQSLDHIRNSKDLSKLPLPIPLSSALPDLGQARLDGFKCIVELSCHKICPKLKEMSRHLRESHNISIYCSKKGRPAKGAAKEVSSPYFRSRVTYQRLFPTGPRSEYFEVSPEAEPAKPSDQEVPIKDFYSNRSLLIQKDANLMEQPDQFTQPSPWLDRLGCVTHLQDFADKKEFLRGLISLNLDLSPGGFEDSDDFIYLMVFKVLDQLVWEAQGLIYRQEVPLNARFEVARYDLNTASRKPFNFRHKQETKRRYANITKQLIVYTLRCLGLDNPAERPPFKVSRQQQKAYDDLMEVADELEEQWKVAQGQLSDRILAQLLEDLKRETLRLFMTILRQQTKDSEHESIMVSFLSVLSIAPDGSWHQYDAFTPWLSGLVAISRLFILKEAHLIRWNAIEAGVARGLSAEEAELNAPGILSLVERRTSQCMLSSTPGAEATPMQYVLRLRSYGIAAKSNTAAPGYISWDGLDLLFKGIRLSLPNLAQLLQSALTAARQVLFRDLLFQQDYSVLDAQPATIPAIPWGKLQDNANNDALGYGVADSLYEVAGEDSKTWLISRIWTTPELKVRWYPNSTTASAPPSITVLSGYLELVDQMLEHLLFLIHLSAGLPARSTEILTIRHRNTAAGGIRNIFIDRGLVMIIIGIHKSLSQSQRLKVIHRFLPQEVGTLLIYYLWLIVPFCEGVLSNLPCNSDQERTLSPFLWKTTGLAENKDDFKAQQSKVTDQMLNTLRSGLGFPIPSESQSQGQGQGQGQAEEVREADTILEPNPNDKYISPSIKSFTPARMTRIMKRWGAVIGIESLGISTWRHISVAIGRRFIRDAAITSQGHFAEAADGDSDSEVSDQEDIGEQDTILNKQTGHSAQTSAMVYGRGIQEAHFETHQRRESFRQLSQEWHYLLGFLSALRSTAITPSRKGAKRSGAYLDLEQFQQLQISRWKQLRGIDISLELDRLFDRPSVFKPGQHKVLTAIMQNQSPIVTVLPTSGGKSLLFQLPVASCPTGVTVVVVPLVALQGDLFKRTQEMNIPTAQWRSDQIVGHARLVFVTPETLFTKHFQGYLDALQSQAQLDRIVIDECHTILEGTLAFRPKLRELGRLAQRGIQMVYLTATLPIAEEAEFFSLIYSTPKSATFFRFPTTRRNIRYSMSSFNIQGVDDTAAVAVAAVRDSIDQILTRYASTAKVIVYCQTKKATQAMAEALGCEAYYSDVGTEDDKARRLRDWMHGIYREDVYQNGRVIVATNALGLGIDIPDIRLIVHLEMPRRIGDYGQQSGRAGRDGLPSQALVLRARRGPSDQMMADKLLDASCREFLSSTQCRRIALDRGLDGRQDRVICEEGEEKCDFCQSTDFSSQIQSPQLDDDNDSEEYEDEETRDVRLRQEATSLVRHTVSAQARQQKSTFDQFRDLLQRQLQQGCIFCRLLEARPSDHIPTRCPKAPKCKKVKVQQSYYQAIFLQSYYSRDKTVADFGACFRCLVPQEICIRWDEDLDSNWYLTKGTGCQFYGIVLSVFSIAFHRQNESLQEMLQDEGFQGVIPGPGRYQAKEYQQLWGWLGERVIWAGVKSIRICSLFEKLEKLII